MDPENNPGAKVPDLVTFPSSTVQLSIDFVVQPDSDPDSSKYGDGVAVWFTPIVGNQGLIPPIWKGTNVQPADNYTWEAVQWPARANMQTLYDVYRPVSACIYAEFIGNSTFDSGQICMGLIPRTGSGPGTSITSFNTAVSQSFTKTLPLRNGACVVWKPQDNLDLEYSPIVDPSGRIYPPQIFIACAGMANNTTNGAASLRIRCVANYEVIPTTDTFDLVDTSPSGADHSALEDAFNWAGQAYNNFSAFVTNVSPYVQPVLLGAAQRYGRQLANGYMSNRLLR
jgi:hypothetical protein